MLPVHATSRRPRLRPMSLITAIAAAAVATAGCAGGTAGSDDDPAGSTTPTQNAISTGAARPASELVRVTGDVEPGGQPGCMVLNADFTKYVLVGGDPAVLEDYEEEDTRVTVTGQAHTSTPTKCTDGVPLQIQKIEPAI